MIDKSSINTKCLRCNKPVFIDFYCENCTTDDKRIRELTQRRFKAYYEKRNLPDTKQNLYRSNKNPDLWLEF